MPTKKRSARSALTYQCRALALLHLWVNAKGKGRTVHTLATHLGRSWVYADRLMRGEVRPHVGEMNAIRLVARIPFQCWLTKAEVATNKIHGLAAAA